MPKAERPAKVKRILTTETVEEPELTEADRRSDGEQQAIDEFIEEVGPEGRTVQLYKRDADTGRMAYCERVPREAFSEQYVQRKWGGGLYQARLRDENNKPLQSRSFQVIALPEPAAPPVAAAVTGDAAMDRALQMTQMMMGAVMAAMAAMKPAREENTLELLTAAKTLFAPSASAPNPQDVVDSVIGSWQRGVEVGRGLEGGGADQGYAGVIRDVIPVLGEIAKAMAQPRAPMARAVMPMPPAPPTLAAGPQPAGPAPVGGNPADPRPVWLKELWQYLPLVAQLASADFHVAEAAHVMLGKLPDAVYEDMALDAEREGFANRALALLPNALVAQYGPWLNGFLAAAQAELTAEEEADGKPVVEVGEGTPPVTEGEEL
jgi:hypothetical protein